jgi:DNA-binding CsgD family transcriptional regulator
MGRGDYATARARLDAALAAVSGRAFGIYLATLLVSVGELASHAGRAAAGRALLELALRHPATTHTMRERAERLLGHGPRPAPRRDREASGDDPHDPVASSQDIIALMRAVLDDLAVAGPPERPASTAAAAHPQGSPTPQGRPTPQGWPIPQEAPRGREAPALVEALSEREVEVLRLLAEGRSNQEIARALVVVVGTVKSHVHNICGKLGVPTRGRAVARAQELGLLAPPPGSAGDLASGAALRTTAAR